MSCNRIRGQSHAQRPRRPSGATARRAGRRRRGPSRSVVRSVSTAYSTVWNRWNLLGIHLHFRFPFPGPPRARPAWRVAVAVALRFTHRQRHATAAAHIPTSHIIRSLHTHLTPQLSLSHLYTCTQRRRVHLRPQSSKRHAVPSPTRLAHLLYAASVCCRCSASKLRTLALGAPRHLTLARLLSAREAISPAPPLPHSPRVSHWHIVDTWRLHMTAPPPLL